MTTFLLVLSAFGVCHLVCGSQLHSLTSSAGESPLQIICEEQSRTENPNFSLFHKFNKFVNSYFVKNFGPGGTKYLQDFGECAKVGELRDHEAVITEMQSIVSEYDKWFGKSIRNVRFRIHRFLGILMLLRQYPELEAPPLVIDYHTAFPNYSDRKRFDDGLRELKSYTHDWRGAFVKNAHFIELVSGCLRLIGAFTIDENRSVFQYSTIAKNWSDFAKILQSYRAYCVKLRKFPFSSEHTADPRETICYALQRSARASIFPKESWDFAASTSIMSVDSTANRNEVKTKLLFLSYYGEGAQVLDCLKSYGMTLGKCLVRREYNDLNLDYASSTEVGYIAARACILQSSPISEKPIRIVRVVLCAGCALGNGIIDPTSPQNRNDVISECSKDPQWKPS